MAEKIIVISMLSSIVYMMGIIGGMDCGTISLFQGGILMIPAFIVMTIFFVYANVVRRHGRQ